MAKPLVIVESPAKAKTIAGFLGNDFVVESSIGHIRDLPRGAADVPAAYKSLPWSRDGVDCENDFKPLYIVPEGRAKDQVRKLKALLKNASELYLATDEDREGESISWHLVEVLNPQVPVRRMVFHEITKGAIETAVANWRDINLPLVDAQETRRILDRLYGYRVSEVLWKKVAPRLSAGRVQSVATRMVVERERERMRFRSASWWDIQGRFAPAGADDASGGFGAGLSSLDGRRIADGRSFASDGAARADVVVLDEEAARALAGRLESSPFSVKAIERRPYTDRPKPPFITSTLQQAAGNKLRFSSARTMQVAQGLYEKGYITYMRTDSTSLSETAVAAARAQAGQLYGREFVADAPRTYAKKAKNAQEAHEAIRPAGDTFRTPDAVRGQLNGDEQRLYDLIWRRTIASQMKDALGSTVTMRLEGTSSAGERAEFSTSGTVITFLGFRKAYQEGADDVEGGDTEERRLPQLSEGDAIRVLALDPEGHATKPPARYTEASLVKAMEDLGVGRPSTYASIISTVQDRGYVWKKGSALIPSFTAFAVTTLLERHFEHLVDYDFTAKLEDDLDKIANREVERVPWLRHFYFGNGSPGLLSMTSEHLDDIDPRDINSIPIGIADDGQEIVARVGRYGPYLQKGDERASVPEDLAPDELTVERALELLSAPSGDRELGTDPQRGLPVVAKAGRYGPYVQLGEPAGKAKPQTSSLFKDMSLDTITLDEALQLLSLPRVVGEDPETGEPITALNGRYGPYLSKGSDSRSLEHEDQLFTITLEEALALYAQPKQRRGAAAPKPPLKELGVDGVSGKPMVVKEGRFGPYVTDGETNASLRAGDSLEEITPDRGSELLAERRAKGPAPAKRGGRKAGAPKKAAAKKATGAKAAAKKGTGTRKAVAKKATGVKKAAARKATGAGPDA